MRSAGLIATFLILAAPIVSVVLGGGCSQDISADDTPFVLKTTETIDSFLCSRCPGKDYRSDKDWICKISIAGVIELLDENSIGMSSRSSGATSCWRRCAAWGTARSRAPRYPGSP